MQVTNNIKSIAIGSFDGIHLGHRALISQVEAVVVIERNGGYLTPGYKRSFCVKQPCFFYHFEHIRALSARAFVEKLYEDFPKLETIVVGYDFGFGYKKEGNTTLLKELFKGEVVIVDEVKEEEISVHSRTIKGYIAKGEIELVQKLLGRPFVVSGKVITGQGLGKKELVPTINLDIYDYDLPKNAVYATRTKIDDEWLASVSFLGLRETTDGAYAIETHVIDKEITEVKGTIWLEFVAYIRDNQKFESLKALKEQIILDMMRAKNIHKG
jgi:riboflavin kinase/FMN adenylyltransferase